MDDVIDDSEATDGGFDGSAASVPVAGRSLVVALAGGSQVVGSIAVSALHHPVDATDSTDFQGRLLGIHDFTVEASNDGGATYTKVYDSRTDDPSGFFPVAPPRAVAPELQLKTVNLPTSVMADHLKLVIGSNTCTGVPAFTDTTLKGRRRGPAQRPVGLHRRRHAERARCGHGERQPGHGDRVRGLRRHADGIDDHPADVGPHDDDGRGQPRLDRVQHRSGRARRRLSGRWRGPRPAASPGLTRRWTDSTAACGSPQAAVLLRRQRDRVLRLGHGAAADA